MTAVLSSYKGLTLSPFQQEAIEAIRAGASVLVSTHTGNGKTLIADFAVHEAMEQGWQTVYTAPIKALSNQKYRQFVKEYGEGNVGLITGDHTLHPEASLLVVTTEVLRNILHETPRRVANVRFIILDEIHYLADPERGTVWEEVIIFKPPTARIIGLSATIPNLDEMAGWMRQIHQEPVAAISYDTRIVPLKHAYFDVAVPSAQLSDLYRRYDEEIDRTGAAPSKPTPQDFIRYALRERILPVLFFMFSRRQAEFKADEMGREMDLLTHEEKQSVRERINKEEEEYPELTRARSWERVKELALRGVAYHHAGLLPVLKQFVEGLFEAKLVKVLFATETFAVGINFPVRTVAFSALRKYDGTGFRTLTGAEYLQMAGRAGRRGIDPNGLVFTLADYQALEHEELPDLYDLVASAVKSQFALRYSTVLSLAHQFSEEERRLFFEKSFAAYQHEERLRTLTERERAAPPRLRAADFVAGQSCKLKEWSLCPVLHEQAEIRARQLDREIAEMKRQGSLTQDAENERANIAAHITLKPHGCARELRKRCERQLTALAREQKQREKSYRLVRKAMEQGPADRFGAEFEHRLAVLESLGHIRNQHELLPRGKISMKLHIQELLLTELVFAGYLRGLTATQLAGVAAGLALEDDSVRLAPIPFSGEVYSIYEAMERIQREELRQGVPVTAHYASQVAGLVEAWGMGEPLAGLSARTGLAEGEIVSVCRRAVDLLRQLRSAQGGDPAFRTLVDDATRTVFRDLVAAGL